MLVPPGLRKCVAYLVVDRVDEVTGAIAREPGGTVFFVAVTDEEDGQLVYAVTAGHVVNAMREYRGAFLRLNKSKGGYADVPVPTADDWTMHHATDVAAARVHVSGEDFDLAAISSSMLMPDEAAVNFNVGEGDEVILLGLFTAHPGASRSEPISRFGHIARMPYDPIPIKMDLAPNADRKSVRAYLVEATAWGGQSGSPAFIHFAANREPGRLVLDGGPEIGVLGLVHGHYPHTQTVAIAEGEGQTRGTIDMNLGISVVIPAEEIAELLRSM